MKKLYLNIYIPILAIMFIIFPIPAHAVCDPKTSLDSVTHQPCVPPQTYVPLEPSAFKDLNVSGGLGAFLGQAFNYIIALAVVLALVMIIWGGIKYMTTDSFSGKDEGKEKIQNALWGLGLALISWLLLSTINPNLVSFSGNTLLNTPATDSRTSGNTDIPATSNNNANKGTAACPPGVPCTTGGVKTK